MSVRSYTDSLGRYDDIQPVVRLQHHRSSFNKLWRSPKRKKSIGMTVGEWRWKLDKRWKRSINLNKLGLVKFFRLNIFITTMSHRVILLAQATFVCYRTH